MTILFAGIIGGWELVLILAVVLMLFGAKRLPELAKGLGTGIKEFKKATKDVTDDLHRAMDEDSHPVPPAPRKLPPPTYSEPTTPPGGQATASTTTDHNPPAGNKA